MLIHNLLAFIVMEHKAVEISVCRMQRRSLSYGDSRNGGLYLREGRFCQYYLYMLFSSPLADLETVSLKWLA